MGNRMFNWLMCSLFILRSLGSGEPMFAVAAGLFAIAASVKDASEA